MLINNSAYSESENMPAMKVPDVLILVMAGFNDKDEISINYSKVVDDETVKNDIQRIKEISKWDIKEFRITNEKANLPGAQLSTSVNIKVKNAVDFESGKLPIGVFVNGLKRLDSIRVNFIMMQTFEFKGIGNYSDDYIMMAFSFTNTTYRYDIIIKDRSFEYIELDIDKINELKAREQNKKTTSVYFIVLLIAVVGAAIGYFVTLYITSRNKDKIDKEG
ncbi:MAG: hypothetical protein SNJ70_04600 [Armatimonadota bacterium]